MIYNIGNAVIPVQHIASVETATNKESVDFHYAIYIETVGGHVYRNLFQKHEESEFQREHRRILSLLKAHHGAVIS